MLGGCEVARAWRCTCLLSDAQIGDFLRILLTTVSEGRRKRLGTARPYSRHGMRRGLGMLRACVAHAGVSMYRGGPRAGSCGVCMWSMGLCCLQLVYESIMLALSAVSVDMNVFRTRFNIYTIQELMVCAPGKLGLLE